MLGFICNSYPEEQEKGTWRAIQWAFNMGGGAVGALVAMWYVDFNLGSV